MICFLKQWIKRNSGSTAVEFSLVGFPFVFITIGIVELALMFTTQSLLQESAFSASRMIRTGQLQITGGNEATFKAAVCDFAKLLIPCKDIQMTVQKMPSFADAADLAPQFDVNGNLIDQVFDPGQQNDVVLVRLAFNYTVKTPLMQPLLANNGTKRTMYSTVVLRTEPYK